ncbi:hypothetical protein Tco_1428900 [Tanacetum coccineum]
MAVGKTFLLSEYSGVIPWKMTKSKRIMKCIESELHQLRTRSIAQRMKFNINQRHGGWKNLKIHHRIYHITGSSSTPTSRKNTIEHRHMGFRNVWNVTVTEVYAEVRGGADITPTVALFTGTAMIYSPLLKLKTVQKKQEEQAAFTPYWKFPIFDDNDDEYTIQYKEYLENSSNAITPNLSTEEPDNSLRMGDEHLSTILKTELDELIKSSVENLVPIQINEEVTFDLRRKDSSLGEKLLFDNSSPRPPKEFNSENSDAIIESFSSSHILVEDSDSLMEEIDLFLTPDDSMPPGIENDNYDSEGDILFLEEFLSNDPPSLPENESFHFVVPSSPRPPAKSSDDGIYLGRYGVYTAKIDTLLPFSSENKDKVHLLSLSVRLLKLSRIALDYESSRARGFVLRSLKL